MRFVLVLGLSVVLAGCATGIGRAVEHAFTGTPESVVAGFDQVEAEYLRLSSAEVEDVEAGKAETPEGKARKGRLLEARLLQRAAVLEALALLREYADASSGEAAAAARQAALARQVELLGLARDLVLGAR